MAVAKKPQEEKVVRLPLSEFHYFKGYLPLRGIMPCSQPHSIVEQPQHHGKSYNKWQGDKARPTQRDELREAIGRAVAQKPTDMDALLTLLQEAGCEVRRGKVPSLKAPGWTRPAWMDSLGPDYGVDELAAVLAGRKERVPRKTRI